MGKDEKRKRGRPRTDDRVSVEVSREIYNQIISCGEELGIDQDILLSEAVRGFALSRESGSLDKRFIKYLVTFLNILHCGSQTIMNDTIINSIIPLYHHVRGAMNHKNTNSKYHQDLILNNFRNIFLQTNAREIVLSILDNVEKIVAVSLPKEKLTREDGQIFYLPNAEDEEAVTQWFSTPVKYCFNWASWKDYKLPGRTIIEVGFASPVAQAPQPEYWVNIADAQAAATTRKKAVENATTTLRIFRVNLIDWIMRTFAREHMQYSRFAEHLIVCRMCGKWLYRATARYKHCSRACKQKFYRKNIKALNAEDDAA